MRKGLLFLIVILTSFIFTSARAAEPDSVVVSGVAQDAVTKNFLVGYVINTYAIDAEGKETLVRSDICRDAADQYVNDAYARNAVLKEWTMRQRYTFAFNLLPGRYRIEVNHELYEPADQIVEISDKKRSTYDRYNLDIFLLTRKAIQLDEAEVKSTRIKMTMKGDTLVYNADAFQLAEGSMLDALAEMMPGLEIRSGGKIYHDGEYVPELLLNGKDFFKGDPNVALKNLPAYTVKELRIYHKAPDGAYLRTNSLADTLSWDRALDVRLKKEYSRSWLGTVEAAGGAGPEQGRYLGRFFVLGFTNRSRFSAYGNVNNLSNMEIANEDGSWAKDTYHFIGDPNSGNSTTQYGGIDFSTESKNSIVKANTSLTVRNEDNHTETYTSTTTFLNSGDVFKRSHTDKRNRSTQFSLNEEINCQSEKFALAVRPDFRYSESQGSAQARSAQFSIAPQETYRGAALDKLVFPSEYPVNANFPAIRSRAFTFNPSAFDYFEGASWNHGLRVPAHSTAWNYDEDGVINFLSNPDKSKSRSWSPSLWGDFATLSPWLKNLFSLQCLFTYTHSNTQTWNHYNLFYPQSGTDLRNQYSNSPSESGHIYINPSYEGKEYKHFSYDIDYTYIKDYNTGKYNLYRFDYLGEEWADYSQIPTLGSLPSTHDWKTIAIDDANSYHSKQNKDSHTLVPSFSIFKQNLIRLDIKPRFTRERRRFADTRSLLSNQKVDDTRMHLGVKTSLQYFFKPTFRLDSLQRIKSRGYVLLGYSRSYNDPDATSLLCNRDTSDPLYIVLGNAELRSTIYDEFKLKVETRTPKRRITIETLFRDIHHAIAQGVSYNAATGAYTYRPENIEGNWISSTRFNWVQTPVGSPFSIENNTMYNFNHNVDLVNTLTSKVNNHDASSEFNIKYSKGKLTARGNVGAGWQYATSDREGFTTRSTYSFRYGLTLGAKELVWGINLSTDLHLLQRRGYDDASMNDNSLVWDAQLSRAIDRKKAWTLMLKGHDLLHQLSNVRRTINAQGLTETWVNSVPSYLMLHLIYRFNWQPKSLRNQ